MPVFLISRFNMKDPARMKEYAARAVPMAQSHGGVYLARTEAAEALDGTFPGGRLVIMQFPDMARFRAFWDSPEYQELRKIRLAASDGDVWLVPA